MYRKYTQRSECNLLYAVNAAGQHKYDDDDDARSAAYVSRENGMVPCRILLRCGARPDLSMCVCLCVAMAKKSHKKECMFVCVWCMSEWYLCKREHAVRERITWKIVRAHTIIQGGLVIGILKQYKNIQLREKKHNYFVVFVWQLFDGAENFCFVAAPRQREAAPVALCARKANAHRTDDIFIILCI